MPTECPGSPGGPGNTVITTINSLITTINAAVAPINAVVASIITVLADRWHLRDYVCTWDYVGFLVLSCVIVI